jgi:hypothetical protein
MTIIECACGCGNHLEDSDVRGRPHRFINGHQNRGKNGGFFGKKHTAKSKEKMSIIVTKRLANPNNHPFFKKKHTEESKKAMSLSHLGLRHTESVKRSISNTLMGTSKSEEHKKNISRNHAKPMLGRVGPESVHWKGGITPEHMRLRHSPEMTIWRNNVFERDNYICQSCGHDKGHILRAHHIFPFAEYPDLRFELENGITFCEKCHRIVHETEINPIQERLLELILSRDNLQPYWHHYLRKEFPKKK